MNNLEDERSFAARTDLSFGLLEVVWAFTPALLAGANLYFMAWLYGEEFTQAFRVLLVVAVILCIPLMRTARVSQLQLAYGNMQHSMSIIIRWLCLLLALLAIGFLFKLTDPFPRRVLLTWAATTPLLIILSGIAIGHRMKRALQHKSNHRRVVFAGYNEASVRLAGRIAREPELCMTLQGYFDDRSSERLGAAREISLLGGLRDLAEYVKRNRVDIIFVSLPIRHLQRVVDMLDELQDTTASVYYLPDIFTLDLIQARTSSIGGIPLVALCESPIVGNREFRKRALDLVLSSIGLVLLSPLLLAISVLVKLSSPGPVIFKQRRCGLDGEEITVFKFRTMTVTEDGAVIRQATRDDERITPIGRILRRHSLDELPQLVNVIQGRMSLVGPRPMAMAHNEAFRHQVKGYMLRHKVRPGITGLAQVKGFRGETRSLEDLKARIHYDLEYLRQWSILLDLKIIVLTAATMFTDKHAY